MINQVTHIALLVRDQQEALDWYREKLGFEVRADEPFPGTPDRRWLTIAPPGQANPKIILQPPEWGREADRQSRIDLIGKSPGLVLRSTDCHKDYEELKAKGVHFVSPPEETEWGISALFVDLYGYVHNLVGPRTTAEA